MPGLAVPLGLAPGTTGEDEDVRARVVLPAVPAAAAAAAAGGESNEGMRSALVGERLAVPDAPLDATP